MNVTRKIKRVKCSECDGSGELVSNGLIDCTNCKSLGWVEPEPHNEVVCPQCNGLGQYEELNHRPCGKCLGKGYHVNVVEIQIEKESCGHCEGLGHLKEERTCSRCDGLGTICSSSIVLEDDIERINEIKEISSEWDFDDIPCPKCSGYGLQVNKTKCKNCHGKGAVERVVEKQVNRDR